MGKLFASVWLISLLLFLNGAAASPACNVLDNLRSIDSVSKAFSSAVSATEQSSQIEKLKESLDQIGDYDFVLPAFKRYQSDLEIYVERRWAAVRLFEEGRIKEAIHAARGDVNHSAATHIYSLRRSQSCDEGKQSFGASSNGTGGKSGAGNSSAPGASKGISRSSANVTKGAKLNITSQQKIYIFIALAVTAAFARRQWKRYQRGKKRSTKRYPCLINVVLRAGKTRYNSQMHDVSQVGGKFTTSTSFEIGFSISVLVLQEWVAGTVRWGNKHYVGIEFNTPLTPAQMAQLTQRKRWLALAAEKAKPHKIFGLLQSRG